jgi:hypothetical protein
MKMLEALLKLTENGGGAKADKSGAISALS